MVWKFCKILVMYFHWCQEELSTKTSGSQSVSVANAIEVEVAEDPGENLLSDTSSSSEISLPVYSSRVADILSRGQVLLDLNQFIEETAYHIITNGDMTSKAQYESYGKRLLMKYPCLAFPGKKHDWVCFIRLHRRTMYVGAAYC